MRGSSPLARGLRVDIDPDGTAARIIPARAGFTPRRRRTRRRRQDHPRSRGVYILALDRNHVPDGSSPLARGLHAESMGGFVKEGIIPARAGFTVLGDPVFLGAEDHPRSRGVYRDRRVTMPAYEGSSPLARGLLGRVRR